MRKGFCSVVSLFGMMDILGGGRTFSPGRGILCSLGRAAGCVLVDFSELMGVRGGGAMEGARPEVFVLSWFSS